MRRGGVLAVAAVVVASAVVSVAPTARAVCGYDPNDPPLTIKQMILSGATGSPAYDALFLGRVRRIRDPGSEGGDVTVRMRVREAPFGGDRDWVRIADHVDPPVSPHHRLTTSSADASTRSSRAIATTAVSSTTRRAAERRACARSGSAISCI